MRPFDFNTTENKKILSLGGTDSVPSFYVNQANNQWWKYYIAQYFPAYKPLEIEKWTADMILEHLGAIQEINASKGGGNT